MIQDSAGLATAAPSGAAVAALALRGITKRFPGVVANDAVDFSAAVGEVHALLGENGAGKSTLSSVVTGLYRADEGEIELYGEPVRFESPRDALDRGICMVHQHFRLVAPFTVAENVVLGDHRDVGRSFILRPRAVEAHVEELGRRYGLGVEPRARIWQLSLGEQQRVEILKALYRDARILILDEPTAVLTPQEAKILFETMRAMAADGRTIVFITHKLHEVMAVADRVTVLRGGRSVATIPIAEATVQKLAALMVGHDVGAGHASREQAALGDVVLEVEGLSAGGDRGEQALAAVTFSLRAGEILAVAGVAGNGQRELAETISGMRAATAGLVRVDGRPLRSGDSRAAIRAGVAHVPEDRLGTGLAPGLSVASNVVLKTYRRRPVSRGPLLRHRNIRERASELIERYQVKAPGPQTPARELSGGNLQKVVIGRELGSLAASPSSPSPGSGGETTGPSRARPVDPRVLIAASPTRGLDVGAIETVHTYLRSAAEQGVAILLISEDLDEILQLADRVVVMYEGAIVGEAEPGVTTVEEIGLLMAGGRA